MSHTIYRMQFHLENQQHVVYDDGLIDSIPKAIAKADLHDTMLTGWFSLNKHDSNARQYLFCEIPEDYVWNKSDYVWTLRKRVPVLSRLHYIHPRNQELYHLRLLLLNVKGATSFDDLKTVNGIMRKSFTDAAIALNLVNNDVQWYECLEDVLINETYSQCRFIFSTILIHCNPVLSSALDIWLRFKERLSTDFMEFNNDSESIAIQKSLQHISKILKDNGRKLEDFNLPALIKNIPDYRIVRGINTAEPILSFEDHLDIVLSKSMSFNKEQKV